MFPVICARMPLLFYFVICRKTELRPNRRKKSYHLHLKVNEMLTNIQFCSLGIFLNNLASVGKHSEIKFDLTCLNMINFWVNPGYSYN